MVINMTTDSPAHLDTAHETADDTADSTAPDTTPGTAAGDVEQNGHVEQAGDLEQIGCCGGAVAWLSTDDAEALARKLAAVSDPVRLQVLSIIANAPAGEVCACDFVGPIGKSQPTISHHLKVLTEARLVEGDKRGRWVWYRLAPGKMATLLGSLASATGIG